MRRHCKIASLPRPLREELNRRLESGISGRNLLLWLNALPEVLSLLYERFDSAPIDEQNLSDWRAGGFSEWQRRQTYLEQLREFSAHAARTEPILAPMASRAAAMLSRHFVHMLSEPCTTGTDLPDLKTLKPLLDLTRAVTSLCRLEQQDIRLKREEERLQAKKKKAPSPSSPSESILPDTPAGSRSQPQPYSVAVHPESLRLPRRF